MTDESSRGRWKKGLAAGALVAAGVGIGAAVATTNVASAATTTPTASSSTGSDSSSKPNVDESKSQRSDEHLLTGDTATKVRDAALAKYPGATVQRVETDSDGVYEAHIVTSAGEHVIVQVGSNFAVTGTQSGRGGHGDHDGDGPRANNGG
jgi:hypothetical protein